MSSVWRQYSPGTCHRGMSCRMNTRLDQCSADANTEPVTVELYAGGGLVGTGQVTTPAEPIKVSNGCRWTVGLDRCQEWTRVYGGGSL